MRLDAPTLARAWLSVAQASAGKDDNAGLNRTVALEEYPTGLRLVATDRYVLLTAWVPDLAARFPREPGLDEAPDRTVIAHDGDGRGKGLLGYVLQLARRDELDDQPEGTLELGIDFDVRLPAGADVTLEGLEPTYVTLTVPDVERVYLGVVETRYPEWRGLVLDHQPQDTKAIALSPELVDRVAKVRRWSDGPLVVTFGGSERVAAVDYPESDPHVTGLLMPRRWVLPGEEPEADDTELPEDED